MYKVKIHGAGSIGNHLANASRAMGWEVTICDIDPAALERTRNQIYPGRYGGWDESIRLVTSNDAPKGGFDLIVVGTPPDSHISLALSAIEERPKAILVEKPFCTPDLDGAQRVWDKAQEAGIAVFTGYDHVVGKASEDFSHRLQSGVLGAVETLDVEFREFWGGIFAAHPWLNGPSDTYLGFWRRGGGASGEHSHAINLWQHFAHVADAGRVVEVSASMEFVDDGVVAYDRLCFLQLRTERGLIGRVVQDVVTSPPRKWARAQCQNGFVEWHCGYKPGVDAVFQGDGKGVSENTLIEKTRPADFIQELRHIEPFLAGNQGESAISAQRGLDTMLVVAAAHLSVRERRVVRIDYSAGYQTSALKLD